MIEQLKKTDEILRKKFDLRTANDIKLFANQTTIMIFGLSDVLYMKLIEKRRIEEREHVIRSCKRYLATYLGITIEQSEPMFKGVFQAMVEKYPDVKRFIKDTHYQRFVQGDAEENNPSAISEKKETIKD